MLAKKYFKPRDAKYSILNCLLCLNLHFPVFQIFTKSSMKIKVLGECVVHVYV